MEQQGGPAPNPSPAASSASNPVLLQQRPPAANPGFLQQQPRPPPPAGPPPPFYGATRPPGMMPPRGMTPYQAGRPPYGHPGFMPQGGFRPQVAPPHNFMPPPHGYMGPPRPPPFHPGNPPFANRSFGRPPAPRHGPSGGIGGGFGGAPTERQKRASEAWIAHRAGDGSERVYYFNQITEESTWERPEGYTGDEGKASSNPVPVSSERVPGTDWLEVVCENEVKYYVNKVTEETTWHVPAEVEAKLRLKLDPAKAKMLERARAMGAQLAPEYRDDVGAGGAVEAAADEDVSFTEDDIGQEGGALPGGVKGSGLPPPSMHQPPQHPQQGAQQQQQHFPPNMPQGGPPFQHQQFRPPPGMPPPPHHLGGPPPRQHFGMPPPQHAPQHHPGMAQHRPGLPPPQHQQHYQGMSPPPIHAGLPPLAAPRPPGVQPSQHPGLPPVHLTQQQQQQQQQPQQQQQRAPQKPVRVKTGYGPDGYMAKEEAVAAFKALLEEKGVHSFSRYEKELPKLQPDKRFKYLPAISERKATFGEFCKEAVGKKKGAAAPASGAGSKANKALGGNSKAIATKTPASDFKQLLDEVQAACSGSIAPAPAEGEEEGQLMPAWDARLHLSDLQERWGNDPRWQGCTAEQRQAAFDQRLAPLRAATRKQQELDYRVLLREAGVTGASRWSRTKDELSADPRYLALPRDDREELFRLYVAEVAKGEEVLREREAKQREAERRLEAEQRTAEQRRRQAAHTEALAHYKALLLELHLGPDARWRDYSERIMRDAQGRGSTSALERGEAESLFKEHVIALQEESVEGFLDLLDAELKPLIPSREQQEAAGLPKPLQRWRDAEPLLEDDQRFVGLAEEYRERVWRQWISDELHNRDFPLARTRTQRRQPRPTAPLEVKERSIERRPGPRPNDGALDKAYLREYIAADSKRQRRE